MCFLDIVTFWYDGVKMVDFGVPSQPREYQPVGVEGLAREGKLLIWRLGWGTGLLHWLHRLACVPLGRFWGSQSTEGIPTSESGWPRARR